MKEYRKSRYMMSNEQSEKDSKTIRINSQKSEHTLKTRDSGRLNFGNRLAQTALLLLFMGGLFFSMLPLGRAMARTALLLPSLLTASEPAPLQLINEPVRHLQKTISSRNGPVYLDIYEPVSRPTVIPGTRGGVVIIPGVGDNRQVPQLVNLLQSMAGAGLVVVNVTTPTIIQYNVSTADSDGVVEAFKFLAQWPGVSASRIGIIAFSAGVTLACLAATDARIRDKLAFVTLFGGYFNVTNLLRVFGQRSIQVDGKKQAWNPQEVPLHVLSVVIATLLPESEGTQLIQAFDTGGTPLTSNDLEHFSTAGAAAYHLLAGDEPDQVNANLDALSPQMHVLLDQLSPSTIIDQIHAPIYLLHDRSDDSIPFTESRDFAATLSRLKHSYDFAEFGIFHHVQVRSDLSGNQLFGDVPHLFSILSKIMLPGS